MSTAYPKEHLHHLLVIKETHRWMKAGFIARETWQKIKERYAVPLYHPNLMIRLLLFLAALLALAGLTGLIGLFIGRAVTDTWAYVCIFYGIVSFLALEMFIGNHHFKSGVTEAILYHASGFTIAGVSGIADFDLVPLTAWACVVVFSFAAYRYLDLITTAAAVLSFAFALFHHLYQLGGIVQQLIPFFFIITFGVLFFGARHLRNQEKSAPWQNVLILCEAMFLLLAYAGGNYLVVRELSVNLLSLQLEPQQDIPFAYVFYALTVFIPLSYLFFGVRRKDIVLIRVSLFMIAFSVFTFKYYYSFGHPEITITLAGALLIIVTLAIMNYLKVIRHGYTRENLLSEKWAGSNVQAFVISQTMGSNVNPNEMPGGGTSGGGGATNQF